MEVTDAAGATDIGMASVTVYPAMVGIAVTATPASGPPGPVTFTAVATPAMGQTLSAPYNWTVRIFHPTGKQIVNTTMTTQSPSCSYTVTGSLTGSYTAFFTARSSAARSSAARSLAGSRSVWGRLVFRWQCT